MRVKIFTILIISTLFLTGCTDNNLNIQNNGLKNSDKNLASNTIPHNDKVSTNTSPVTQKVSTNPEMATNTSPAHQGVITEEIKKASEPIQNLYKVARVVDGDTIELENGEKVR